eukprot:TRINITY_DN1951_c1_g1_i1.p1 TRINITY_DN1951_c1_g1~~TRINITY_DN1951_c1_g1_i1.p1  ORF type:complete len:216 (-),score=55.62 TRINITY_DN1951_c1_g1_i1:196-843(-)
MGTPKSSQKSNPLTNSSHQHSAPNIIALQESNSESRVRFESPTKNSGTTQVPISLASSPPRSRTSSTSQNEESKNQRLVRSVSPSPVRPNEGATTIIKSLSTNTTNIAVTENKEKRRSTTLPQTQTKNLYLGDHMDVLFNQIASSFGIPENEREREIEDWKRPFGKYCRTIGDIKKIVFSTHTWPTIVLDPLVRVEIEHSFPDLPPRVVENFEPK